MPVFRHRATAALALLLFAPALALAEDARPAPEAATGTSAKGRTIATRHMAVAADPVAAEAALDILRKGGSAVDAAIAAQLVLGLVEPQSSGLGGGAFIVHWDAAASKVETIDARETAPAAAKPDRFIRDGRKMSFAEAVASGLSVGAPGVVRGLELAHKKHGKLPWATLFEPAIKLADDGFPVSRRLNLLLRLQGAESLAPAARSYFFDEQAAPRPAGYVLKNPDYAATLKAISRDGAAVFYEGPIADAIVEAVANAPIPGDLKRADLAAYAAKEREPLCVDYRAKKICGMGAPSSGMLTIGQMLKLIEPLPGVTGAANALAAPALHAITEAEKLAFADRNKYIADPEFVAPPDGLLDETYLASRRALINPLRAMARPAAGLPPGLAKRSFGMDGTHEVAGTSHLSIIDDAGNAVAMTTTIENGFGSRLWAAGFLLNNQMTDFSFDPADKDGQPVANRVEAGKRPRSSMAPTLVFDAGGKLEAVTGSPGGSRIIWYIAKTLIAMIDWGMDAQAAAALVNFGSDGGAFEIEPDMEAIWPALALKGYGHEIRVSAMTSGVHTILRRDGKLYGGVDPRREGAALGD